MQQKKKQNPQKTPTLWMKLTQNSRKNRQIPAKPQNRQKKQKKILLNYRRRQTTSRKTRTPTQRSMHPVTIPLKPSTQRSTPEQSHPQNPLTYPRKKPTISAPTLKIPSRKKKPLKKNPAKRTSTKRTSTKRTLSKKNPSMKPTEMS